MGWHHAKKALHERGLRSSEKCLLLCLAIRANEKDECYPSIQRLTEDTGLNKETVISAARSLEARGLIRRVKGCRTSVTYRLVAGDEDPSIQGNQNSGKPHLRIPENRTFEFRKTGTEYITEEVIEEKYEANASSSVASGDPTIATPCPHREIIALYHEILPELQGVLVERWDGQRAKDLATRWRESPKHQTAAFWRWYFGQVRMRRFYLGENERGWRADLGWLVKARNFTKILEAAVSAQQRRVAA